MIQYTTNISLEEEVASMAFTKPEYSHGEVDHAGNVLVRSLNSDGQELLASRETLDALNVVDNFRSAHAFPLNTLKMNLLTHADSIDHDRIVAQRMKRLNSILAKLKRFKTMGLWEMQDIGGCRAIVGSVEQVNQLADIYESGSTSIRHELVGRKNYILHPKSDGYRSRHVIFRYVSDRNADFNEMKIEIQIRTILQHAWATAVETVDAFTNQALKASMGAEDWKRFFQLMSTEIAYREQCTLVPGTPKDRDEWVRELKDCANDLQVRSTLLGFANALHTVQPTKSAQYYLLSLDTNADRLSISGYDQQHLVKASEDYAQHEKTIREQRTGDAVLVSVDSITNLRRAYPNYFADTAVFVGVLDECLAK